MLRTTGGGGRHIGQQGPKLPTAGPPFLKKADNYFELGDICVTLVAIRLMPGVHECKFVLHFAPRLVCITRGKLFKSYPSPREPQMGHLVTRAAHPEGSHIQPLPIPEENKTNNFGAEMESKFAGGRNF